MKSKLKNLCFLLISGWTIFNFSSCSEVKEDGDESEKDSATVKVELPAVVFNSDSAYAFVQKQVDFGPRVPNSTAHSNCGNWMTSKLSEFVDTIYLQKYVSTSYKGEKWNGTNIIGAINPNAKDRILLCAHWDTRPQADQDHDNPNTPSDGACDGASGIGILMEIARQFKISKPTLGVDFIFFDLEDGGSNGSEGTNTWCLGSQYWGSHPHIEGYKAKNGILLDMVGAKNAVFAREQSSDRFDNYFLSKVWQTGASLGFGNYFINYMRGAITDDHFYVSFFGKVPTIDIIEYNHNTFSGFGDYWHTHRDNMSIIDKNTLSAVGKTVMTVVYKMQANIL